MAGPFAHGCPVQFQPHSVKLVADKSFQVLIVVEAVEMESWFTQNQFAFPAQAGTHSHRFFGWIASDCGYGSPPSRGRQLRRVIDGAGTEQP
jgi:hypothetical protein